MVDGVDNPGAQDGAAADRNPETTDAPQQARAPSEERRSAIRRGVELPAEVNILVEEMTFSPFQFKCVCQNISRSGALVIVRDLAKHQFVQLIRRPRYVRIGFTPPDHEKMIWLFGKLIWFDFKETPEGPVCKLASSFEPMKDEIMDELDRYLEWLESQPSDS